MTLLDPVVLAASELPDPGSFGTITGAATFGACVGALVAYLRGHASERATDVSRIGMLVGFGVGVSGWLIALAIHLL